MTNDTRRQSEDLRFISEAKEQVEQVYNGYRTGNVRLSGELVSALSQIRDELIAIRDDFSSDPAAAAKRDAACGLIGEMLRQAAAEAPAAARAPLSPTGATSPPMAQLEGASSKTDAVQEGPGGAGFHQTRPSSEPLPMWSPPPPPAAYPSYNWAPPPPAAPQRRTRRTIAIVAGSVVTLIIALGVIGAIAGTAKHNTNSHTSSSGEAVPVNKPATPAGFTAFTSKADQFTIDVPRTWKAVDPTSPGAQAAMNEIEQSNPDLQSSFGQSAIKLAEQGIALMAINTQVDAAGFASNVNVEAKPALTFSASDLPQIAASLPTEYAKLGGTITGITYLTFDGHQALRSTDTMSLNTPLGTHISVSQTQYFVGANGFLYALTLSGSDPDLAAIASSFSTS